MRRDPDWNVKDMEIKLIRRLSNNNLGSMRGQKFLDVSAESFINPGERRS